MCLFYVLTGVKAVDLSDVSYNVPTLEELKIKPSDLGPTLYPGGETEALDRLNKQLKRTVRLIRSCIPALKKHYIPAFAPHTLNPHQVVNGK